MSSVPFEPMIRLQELSYAYEGRAAALDRVSLDVPPGALLGLVGANGSGKSTLLTLLAGILSPTSGSIRAAGCVSPGQERELRRATALVVQDADLQIIGSTVEEDLCLPFGTRDAEGRERARNLARRFGLDDVWNRPVQTLSWGGKRKLCLAGALLRDPQVLLLDEPFAGLDYPGVRRMREILGENKAAGLTQIVAVHELEPLADIADAWAVLSGGRLVLAGSGAEVFPGLEAHDVRPPFAWRAGLEGLAWDSGAPGSKPPGTPA